MGNKAHAITLGLSDCARIGHVRIPLLCVPFPWRSKSLKFPQSARSDDQSLPSRADAGGSTLPMS